ncbi:MAG: CHAD domain-containing protein [Phycisphaerae bacterium]
MAYRIRDKSNAACSVRQVALSQIAKAAAELDVFDDDPAEAVHQVRKRFKKIRGLIRLVRPSMGKTYKKENRWFRDQARRIAEARDAAALVETIDRLAKHADKDHQQDACQQVREVLVEQRDAKSDSKDLAETVRQIRIELDDAIDRVESWQLDEMGYDAIGPGLGKTYGRARKAMDKAYKDPSSHAFHQWRKRVKYHRYHCKLLREIWQPMIMQRRDQAKRLTDLLGWDHDQVVLREHLTGPAGKSIDQAVRSTVIALSESVSRQHRRQAKPLGRKLFAETKDDFAQRIGAIYEVWAQVE